LAYHCEKEHKGISFACSCKFCPAQFKTSSDWGLHFIQQHGFICPVCQKDLGNIAGLNQHCASEHEMTVRLPLECYSCKKVLVNLNDWSDHYSSHWGVDKTRKDSTGAKIDLKGKIESEKNDKANQLLNEENLQLRQLIFSLCKNSVSLMQKVNLNDPSLKDFAFHCNTINIPRAPLNDLKNLSSEQEQLTLSLLTHEDLMCVICYDKKRQFACFPCGHFVYCDSCKPKDGNIPICPYCRAKVQRFDNVFIV